MEYKFINERTKQTFLFPSDITRVDPQTNERLKLLGPVGIKEESVPGTDLPESEGVKIEDVSFQPEEEAPAEPHKEYVPEDDEESEDEEKQPETPEAENNDTGDDQFPGVALGE